MAENEAFRGFTRSALFYRMEDLANAGLLADGSDGKGNEVDGDVENVSDNKPLLDDYMMSSRRRRPSRDFLDIVSSIKIFSKNADVIVLICNKGSSANIINAFGDLKNTVSFIVINNPEMDINIIKSNILKKFL